MKLKTLTSSDDVADHVVCNWCGKKSFVRVGADICPSCHKEGYLMDIEQEVDMRGKDDPVLWVNIDFDN